MTINKQTKTKKINAFIKKTKEDLINLNIYKVEFDTAIRRYAEMRLAYEILNDKWFEDGCVITEEYTNKSGATNKRKTAQYSALENLRKELLDLENTLGLTPKGLKALKAKGFDNKKTSALDKVLSNGL